MKINVASEHKKGKYKIGNKKGVGYYNYIFIETEELGNFYVSHIKVNKKISNIRTDGYPWEFLTNESKYKLTQEQINFIEQNKEFILKEISNLHEKNLIT